MQEALKIISIGAVIAGIVVTILSILGVNFQEEVILILFTIIVGSISIFFLIKIMK